MQLNKFISQAGLCSRRKAVELIKTGQVTVGGILVNHPGHRVTPSDQVKVAGTSVCQPKRLYLIMNKPSGYITTTADEKGRATVLNLLGSRFSGRVYPVGRLDKDTTGLLLLTNDGAFAQQVAHPRYELEKTYRVELDRPLFHEDARLLMQGIYLSDGKASFDALRPLVSRYENRRFEVVLHSGRHRIVRRMFEHLSYNVIRLDRVAIGPLTKRGLKEGAWRFLTSVEIANLTPKKKVLKRKFE